MTDPERPEPRGFGPWRPLSEAAEAAPAGAGVLQVKARGALVHYPAGKSAMLLYLGVEGLAGWLAERQTVLEDLATDRGITAPLMVRWQSTDRPGELAAEHLARFVGRFGGLPLLQRRPPEIAD